MPEALTEFNHNQPVYTVSEVSLSIKRTVEEHFGVIRIRGEISGFKQAASGHVYFRLKDDNAVLDGVMWRGTASKLSFKAEDGLEVVCTGKVTTYPGRSSYQIVVDYMEPAGVGALMALLEKRRKALEAEGLFDPKRKKPLPYLPRIIGVVTSPTGAVIRDILHRIGDRFPLHVLVWPVMVQGEGAAEQIAAAIAGFNAMEKNKPDVLIVARGGGSIEDLWAFNEEIVVRAAAASLIPLISAVGHETDTTLIDYASDMRAPTPTAAAEMAVPILAELRQGVHEVGARLTATSARLFENVTQKLDDLSERLAVALPLMLARKTQHLAVLAASLQPRILFAEIKTVLDKLSNWQKRMQSSVMRIVETNENKVESLGRILENVNYQKVLERGFALVKDAQGKLVTTAKQAKAETALSLTFKDGAITVKH